eukprot:2851203-Amphidinium_carterae.1
METKRRKEMQDAALLLLQPYVQKPHVRPLWKDLQPFASGFGVLRHDSCQEDRAEKRAKMLQQKAVADAPAGK